MIKVGIVGAAGYTGGELIRILSAHPDTKMSFCQSNSQAGKAIQAVHSGCMEIDMHFVSDIDDEVDLLFFCMGHGRSRAFMEKRKFQSDLKIIDLSHDFRIKDGDHSFVYGLPELQREEIRKSKSVANPGCFATAIQLALLPMAATSTIRHDIHIHAITGSTGAGQSLRPTTHFSWRNNNISVYKAFQHQHLGEIKQSLIQLDKDFDHSLHFVPMRGDFTRGILASMYFDTEKSEDQIIALYQDYYKDHPFVRITDQNPDLKSIVNTNFCLIHPRVYDGKVHIISIIDNLVKGASGQAVQNMNLIFDLPETTGLKLKASAF